MTDLLERSSPTGSMALRSRGWMGSVPVPVRAVGAKFVQLVVLLFAVSTLLFILLRIAGDPATVLGGADATPADRAAIRRAYGLDGSLALQYWRFISRAAHFDFSTSLLSGDSALHVVLTALPYTVELAAAALVVEILIAVPLGVWLGIRPTRTPRRLFAGLVFIAQGVPGYVTGLLLIELFAVQLRWLPSIGATDWTSWIMPTLTLAAYITPRLVRVLAANVNDTMSQDFIQVARAGGASERSIALRQALPNALIGTTALIGGQFAILIAGSLITEVIFAWPGVGLLMINSVRQLDFPVIQALVFMIAILVFMVNSAADLLLVVIDPRLKRRGGR